MDPVRTRRRRRRRGRSTLADRPATVLHAWQGLPQLLAGHGLGDLLGYHTLECSNAVADALAEHVAHPPHLVSWPPRTSANGHSMSQHSPRSGTHPAPDTSRVGHAGRSIPPPATVTVVEKRLTADTRPDRAARSRRRLRTSHTAASDAVS